MLKRGEKYARAIIHSVEEIVWNTEASILKKYVSEEEGYIMKKSQICLLSTCRENIWKLNLEERRENMKLQRSWEKLWLSEMMKYIRENTWLEERNALKLLLRENISQLCVTFSQIQKYLCEEATIQWKYILKRRHLFSRKYFLLFWRSVEKISRRKWRRRRHRESWKHEMKIEDMKMREKRKQESLCRRKAFKWNESVSIRPDVPSSLSVYLWREISEKPLQIHQCLDTLPQCYYIFILEHYMKISWLIHLPVYFPGWREYLGRNDEEALCIELIPSCLQVTWKYEKPGLWLREICTYPQRRLYKCSLIPASEMVMTHLEVKYQGKWRLSTASSEKQKRRGRARVEGFMQSISWAEAEKGMREGGYVDLSLPGMLEEREEESREKGVTAVLFLLPLWHSPWREAYRALCLSATSWK